jgi:hypothetical protein
LQVLAETGQCEARVAARRRGTHPSRFQEHHRCATARDFKRRGQARETAADNTNIDVDVVGQPRVLCDGRHDGSLPTRAVSLLISHDDR